jgi:glycosyltransferase involved in cell wall biosynthesis
VTREYVYILPDGLPATVVDSQVIGVLRRLADQGLPFQVFAYQFRPSRPERERIRQRLAALRQELPGRIRLWLWPSPAVLVGKTAIDDGQIRGSDPAAEERERRIGPWRRWALGMRDLVVACWIFACLLPAIVLRRRIVVHARGNAALIGLRLRSWYRGFRVLLDVRGDAPAEALFKAARGGLASDGEIVREEQARLLALERRIVTESDSVQAVSEALRRRLSREHGVALDRIRVVPGLADERLFRFDPPARSVRRRELGLGDERLVVYSGSLTAWQALDGLMQAWRSSSARLDKSRLLLLTPEHEAAQRMLRDFGLHDGSASYVRSAPFPEVAGYLSAADVGLLLRDRHPLNAAASPTKLGEYLLCGLPVVASAGIGDLDEALEKDGFGVLVEAFREPGRLETALERATELAAREPRASRAARAVARFGLGPQIAAWTELYRRL